MPTIAATPLGADAITAAAIARYGHEDGATADILAGTPVILICANPGRYGMGRAIPLLVGPAIRLTDGTHLYAVDPDETIGYYLTGRRADDDTWQAAARRATRRMLADNTLPVDIVRGR
ncbi:hypothetical protein TPA0907_56010 [Micromonospora humidisoli]|uniref:hypothetical protein n=1 Tax=Micromonospora sp. AKA109 TaxID=2733865 RepID=UPI0022BE125B|nr:hypothetical protein [Micromonospora sp. AKA109]GHJ11234.1 hypothetical protein TPA0907_56010 [Micromonospora sp. AKA109]